MAAIGDVSVISDAHDTSHKEICTRDAEFLRIETQVHGETDVLHVEDSGHSLSDDDIGSWTSNGYNDSTHTVNDDNEADYSEQEEVDGDKCIRQHNYTCNDCGLTSSNVKHGQSIASSNCKKCSYATKCKQKLLTHETAHARLDNSEAPLVATKTVGDSSPPRLIVNEQNCVDQEKAITKVEEGMADSNINEQSVENTNVDKHKHNKAAANWSTEQDCQNTEDELDKSAETKTTEETEWAVNNRMDDEDFRKTISVPTHAIPPLDESDSEEEGALFIAEDEAEKGTATPGSKSSEISSLVPASRSPQMSLAEHGELPPKKKRPPRQEIDPNKYKEILDEEGKIKYSCTACGSAYTWKKSLSKHWKEKHDDSKIVRSSGSPLVGNLAKTSALAPQLSARLNCDRIVDKMTSPVGYTPINIPKYMHSRPVFNSLSCFPISGVGTEEDYKEPSRDNGDVYGNPFTEVLHQKSKSDLGRIQPMDQPIDLSIKKEPPEHEDINSAQRQLDIPLDFSMVKDTRDSPRFDSGGFIESSASLQCSKCGQVATDLEEFNKHMELHLTKRGHNCAECRTKFRTSDDLNRHFSDVHRDKILDTAQIAHQMDRGTQQSKSELRQNVGGLNCTECDFIAKWPTELQKHAMVHSSERPFVCMVCNADYKWKWDLVKHFDKSHHSLPNPYRKRDLSPHFKTVELGESLEPARKRKSSEVKHAITDENPPFMCSVCGFHCKFQFQMVLHMREVHEIIVEESDTRGSTGDEMTYVHRHQSELKINIPQQKMYDSDEELELSEMEVPLSSPGTHASARVRESLKQHLTHIKQQPKQPIATSIEKLSSADILLPYKCSLCEYRARWPSEITQHMKNHSDEKPYLCPRCSYRSKWKWDVVKHLKRCGGGTIKDVIDTTKHKTPKYQRSTLPKFIPPGEKFITVPPPHLASSPSPPPAHSSHVKGRPVSEPQDDPATNISNADIPAAHTVLPSTTLSHSPLTPTARSATPEKTRPSFPMSLGLMPVSKNSPSPVLTSTNESDNNIKVNSLLTSGGSLIKHHTEEKADAMYGQPAVATSALLAQLETGFPRVKSKPVHGLINEGLHHCLNCAFVASSPAELRRHIILHSEEKPFRCESCEYQTKWKCDLKKHVQAYGHRTSTKFVARSKAGRMNESLNLSSETTVNNSYQEDYVQTNERDQKEPLLQCESCDYTTHKRHLLESHQKIHEKPGQVQGNNKYKCKQCQFNANDLPSFLQHKVEHSNQQAQRAAAGSPASVADDDVKARENCHSPKQGRHSRKPTKKIYCSLCPFACVDPVRMEYHNRMHVERSTFTCNFCSFSVEDKNEVEHHMHIHPEYTRTYIPSVNLESSTSDPFPTAEGYEITRKGNRKLYQCKKCPYSNESHGNITRHVEKHGQNSKYKCPKCDYSLDRLNLLLQHTRGVHGIHDADKVWLNYSNFMQSVSQLKQMRHHSPRGASEEKSPQLEVQKEYQISDNPRNLAVRGGAMQVVFRGVKHKMYKCPKCPYKSKKEVNCHNHIRMHGTHGSFMCSHCDYGANKMEIVKRHMENVHNDVDALVLINKPQETTQTIAGHVTPNEGRCVDHETAEFFPRPQVMEMEADEKLPAEERESDYATYRENVVTPTNQEARPFFPKPRHKSPMYGSPKLRRCNICPYAVKGRLPFERHMECHNKDGRYTCKHCNYSLDRLNLLYQHMQLHGDMSKDIPSKNKSSMKIFNRRKMLTGDVKSDDFTFIPTGFVSGAAEKELSYQQKRLNEQIVDEIKRESDQADSSLFKHTKNSNSVFPEREMTSPVNRSDKSSVATESDKCEFVCHSGETNQDEGNGFALKHNSNGTAVDESSYDLQSCPECPFIAETDEECEKHYKCHANRYKYQCDYCSFSHDRVDLLYQHRKLHSDTADFDTNPDPSKLEATQEDLELPLQHNESLTGKDVDESGESVPPAKKRRLGETVNNEENDSTREETGEGMEQQLEHRVCSINDADKHSVVEKQETTTGRQTPVSRRSSRSRERLSVDSAAETRRERSSSMEISMQYSAGVYCCEKCPYTSNNKANYLNHSERHKKSSKFNCPYCSYSTGRHNQCLNHTRLHFTSDSEFDMDDVSAKILEASATDTQDAFEGKRKRTKSLCDRQ